MTKFEQDELNELGMTPEELEERRREVEAKLHAEPNGTEPARQRRTRSDKGVARAPKVVAESPRRLAAELPAPPGAITKQQAAQLVRLAEIMCASHQKLDEARRENHQALHDYCKYVESLTN